MKTYTGKRGVNGPEVHVIDGEGKRPLEHRVHHSPDGFEWGYGGSGPHDLGLSILYDLLGESPERALYNRFTKEFVAKWPGSGWTITEVEIRNWMREF